jgi:TPR repeat protein
VLSIVLPLRWHIAASIPLCNTPFCPPYTPAAQWFRLSADQGHLPAMFALGVAYLNGQGVNQDSDEAARLLVSAAKQGHEYSRDLIEAVWGQGGVDQR